MLFLCKLPEAGNVLAKITQLVKFNSDFESGCHWCVGLSKVPAAQDWERGKGLSPGVGPLAQNRSPQSMWPGIWAAAGIPVQHGGSLHLSDWNQLCGTKFSGLPPISLSSPLLLFSLFCSLGLPVSAFREHEDGLLEEGFLGVCPALDVEHALNLRHDIFN